MKPLENTNKSIAEAQARWQQKYGHMTEEERAVAVRRDLEEGLARLDAAGIKPTMSADELMALTRGDDPDVCAAEIQVFAMHRDEQGDKIAEGDESIDHYDILVRGEETADGDIPEIEEHENLSLDEVNRLLPELESKYDVASEFVGERH